MISVEGMFFEKTIQLFSWAGILIFFLLAYILFWVPLLVSGSMPEPGTWAILPGVLGPYSPLLAAAVV